jgi:hypothetical protein
MSTNLGVYYDVTNVEIVGPYTLRLTFDDGHKQVINFEPILYGPVFEPLRALNLFNQVQLNTDTGTIEWPTGADFNPVVYMIGLLIKTNLSQAIVNVSLLLHEAS